MDTHALHNFIIINITVVTIITTTTTTLYKLSGNLKGNLNKMQDCRSCCLKSPRPRAGILAEIWGPNDEEHESSPYYARQKSSGTSQMSSTTTS